MKPELALETPADAGDASASVAGYLLAAERVVMGFVLLGFGFSGVLNMVPDSTLPVSAADVGGVMMKAGFAYPLLKGIEVLLELYIGRARKKKLAEGRAVAVAPVRSVRLRTDHPRRRSSRRLQFVPGLSQVSSGFVH